MFLHNVCYINYAHSPNFSPYWFLKDSFNVVQINDIIEFTSVIYGLPYIFKSLLKHQIKSAFDDFRFVLDNASTNFFFNDKSEAVCGIVSNRKR